ncbi:MAG: VIT1/CCC1 transporter family protein [Bryobacteraceae bacterium]|nr:VIT1/CCC1 transporter family protein [Bryobacteraceae bacterium]
MPSTPHIEAHFTSSAVVRDIVIGMADGLTVPFALAAGLSGAVDGTRIVVVAGLAEIAAGAIAMGLGGYLAAKNDAEHYASELHREEREVVERTADEEHEVREILETYGLQPAQVDPIIAHFKANPKVWVDWMMRFELGLEAPDPGRALKSAATIAISYIAGGLVPLTPYMLAPTPGEALLYSVAATLAALFGFGYMKGTFTGTHPWQSAFRTTLIGGLAAAAAYGIAKAIG